MHLFDHVVKCLSICCCFRYLIYYTLSEINHWMDVDISHQTSFSENPHSPDGLTKWKRNLFRWEGVNWRYLLPGLYRYSTGTLLMGNLYIHSMIYFWECIYCHISEQLKLSEVVRGPIGGVVCYRPIPLYRDNYTVTKDIQCIKASGTVMLRGIRESNVERLCY